MIYSELLGITRTARIGSGFSFRFVIMLGAGSENMGH